MKKTILFICFHALAVLANAQSPMFQWARNMGGNLDEMGNSIAVDASGNVYTTGYFFGTSDFDPGPGIFNLTSNGANDIFISKLDASGNFVWAKSIGNTGMDYGFAIALDALGNIYTTGVFQYTTDFDPGAGVVNLIGTGSGDVFISKLSPLGNFIWAKTFSGTLGSVGNSIAVDGTGNVYTTGTFNGTADFDPGAGTANLTTAGLDDVFISKLDASGNFVWAKTIGGSSYDNSFSITVGPSNDPHITGVYQGTVDFDPGVGVANLTSVGSGDIFILKLNSSGNFVMAKNIGGISNDRVYSIKTDGAGNMYTTGFFQDSIDCDPGAGIYNLISFGSVDIFISKLDSFGNFVWAKNIGGTSSDIGSAIAVNSGGEAYTTGYFQLTADFDPNGGVANITASGSFDLFISKLDASGNFVWAKNIGGVSALGVNGTSITIDISDNIYVTGSFSGTCDFDPNAGIYSLTAAGSISASDIFVFKLSQTPIGVDENINNETQISIYPNPSNGSFNIFTSQQIKNGIIEIYNTIGELIFSQKIINQQSSIDLKNQASGLYFVKVISDGEVIGMKKVVKE